MAASSADDIPTQLAALLGKKKVVQIRKTDENPPRISIIATINGKDKNHAAEDLLVPPRAMPPPPVWDHKWSSEPDAVANDLVEEKS